MTHNTEQGEAIVAGQELKYVKSGEGKPSIVFMSGHRTPFSNWNALIPRVSGFGTVLAYDRLDTGGSARSSSPQDGDAILSTLSALLKILEVPPPYILVAHSLGGLYANLYARRNPDKVGAVIMVEAAHPGEASEQPHSKTSGKGLLGRLSGLFKPGFMKDPNSEFNNVETTVRQIENAPAFPDIFLAVITGGIKMPFVPRKAFESHLQWQKKLASLSLIGYQVSAEKSGHAPQISEPDVVVQAIFDAIESLK